MVSPVPHITLGHNGYSMNICSMNQLMCSGIEQKLDGSWGNTAKSFSSLLFSMTSSIPSFKRKHGSVSADCQWGAPEWDTQAWLLSETRHRAKWSIVEFRSGSSHLTCKSQVIGLVMGYGDFHLEVTASLPAQETAAAERHCSWGAVPRTLGDR